MLKSKYDGIWQWLGFDGRTERVRCYHLACDNNRPHSPRRLALEKNQQIISGKFGFWPVLREYRAFSF